MGRASASKCHGRRFKSHLGQYFFYCHLYVVSMSSLCRLYVVSMSSHALKLTRTTRLKLSHHILVNSIVVMILAREARVRVRVEEAHIVENFFFFNANYFGLSISFSTSSRKLI